MKTTKEDFALYKRWEKHILDSQPKLTKGIVKATLIAYCHALAVPGSSGIGCYASNTTLARQLGMNRDSLGKYRDEALRLGWFTPTGKRVGRVEVLNVSIPADDEETQVSTEVVSGKVQAPAIAPARDTPTAGADRNCNCIGCDRGAGCIWDDES